MGRYSTSFIVTLAVALFFEIRSKKLYFTGFSLTSADLCGRAVRQFGREIESAFPLITLNSTHFDRQQTRRQYTYVLHVKYILQFTWLKLIKKNCLIKRSTLFSGLSEKDHQKKLFNGYKSLLYQKTSQFYSDCSHNRQFKRIDNLWSTGKENMKDKKRTKKSLLLYI